MTYQTKGAMLRLSNVESKQVTGTLTLKRTDDLPVKATEGGQEFPVKFTEGGQEFPVKFTEGERITVESDPAQSDKPTEKDMDTNVNVGPTGKLLFGPAPTSTKK